MRFEVPLREFCMAAGIDPAALQVSKLDLYTDTGTSTSHTDIEEDLDQNPDNKPEPSGREGPPGLSGGIVLPCWERGTGPGKHG